MGWDGRVRMWDWILCAARRLCDPHRSTDRPTEPHMPPPSPMSIHPQGAVNLAKRHYVVSSLWIAGLICLAFFRGLVVPPDRLQRFDGVMRGIDHKQ